jgi:uncharacterized OsmC-like protein
VEPTKDPTPVELFVISLATAVHAEYHKTDRPPARVASIHLRVVVPAGLPVELAKRLHAVVSHRTVHNTLRQPPTVDIKIDCEPVLAPA